MYNNQRSVQILERDYTIWNHQSWNKYNPVKRWLVWEWFLNWDATATVWTNWTATNITWVDWWAWYTKQSASFNWTTSYIQVADYNWIDLTTEYTMGAFLNMSALPTAWNLYAVIDKNAGWNWWEFELWNNWWTQVIFISHWNASATTTYQINYTLPTNTDILLSATYSWTTIKFWLNWLVIWTVTWVTRTCWVWTSVLEIWRSPSITARYFNWKIKLVRIFNIELTQKEIQLLYKEWLKLLH